MMKHLLIVDDEKENRDALIDIFSSEFEIETAKDGVEAIEKTESQTPDLIILDILMPRMDGFQTCLKLRQNEKTRRVPIIFLTSKSEPETESFGLELGADDFVTKPFNKEVLKTRVNKRLNSPPRETDPGTCELDASSRFFLPANTVLASNSRSGSEKSKNTL